MSDIPQAKTTVQEYSQYENDIQAIEASHRNDLAVHLYSAHLLHQVNPQFPGPEWTSWPLRQECAPDPRMKTDVEDFVVGDLEYSHNESNPQPSPANRVPDEYFGVSTATLQNAERKVHLQYKRRQLSNPKATLVNEMHFLLQRKIREQATRKKGSKKSLGESLRMTDDSEMMKIIATRLANRLGKLVDQLSDQKRRRIVRKKDPLLNYQRTWQDVLLANVYCDKLDSQVDVDSHRKAYQKMRKLFKDVPYPYENDPDFFETEENDPPSDIPDFTVSDNVDAIESDSSAPGDMLGSLQDQLERRRKDQEFKERLFMGLMDQSIRDKQLSWAESDHVAGPYIPNDDLIREYREKTLSDVTLKPRNFETRIKRQPFR